MLTQKKRKISVAGCLENAPARLYVCKSHPGEYGVCSCYHRMQSISVLADGEAFKRFGSPTGFMKLEYGMDDWLMKIRMDIFMSWLINDAWTIWRLFKARSDSTHVFHHQRLCLMSDRCLWAGRRVLLLSIPDSLPALEIKLCVISFLHLLYFFMIRLQHDVLRKLLLQAMVIMLVSTCYWTVVRSIPHRLVDWPLLCIPIVNWSITLSPPPLVNMVSFRLTLGNLYGECPDNIHGRIAWCRFPRIF